MKKNFFTLSMLVLVATAALAQRQEINLKKWQFSHDGKTWEEVVIPHDWAIGGPFDKKWDLQCVAIEQNGETEATEKSGRSGALPWIGEGHYRTQIVIPDGFSHGELVFDGAMSEPVVKVNGEVAGEWKYGYNAFRIDISNHINNQHKALLEENEEQGAGNKKQTAKQPRRSSEQVIDIEVDLKNIEESSRWYPGSGLYRPVKLVLTGAHGRTASIDEWGTFVRVVSADEEKAVLDVTAKVLGTKNEEPDTKVKVLFNILDANGNPICDDQADIDKDGNCHTQITLLAPYHAEQLHLWSPESPYLYTFETMLFEEQAGSKGNVVIFDKTSHKLGLRTVKVSAERGFELNGVSRKLQGVCLHHDLGPLGAALNKSALIRQIRILKDMGCDAIRTSHNMPSTWQMEVCDSMGMMVMAESFDMWIYPKCKNGYARFFKEWALKDITNLVLNHRNHPCIVMWGIGNEIPEQWDANEGVYWARTLQDTIHQLDPTRPVTQGMDRAEDALKSGFAQVMDVPGFNYHLDKYERNMEQLTTGFLLGSETASTVSSRGVYKFPVELSDYSQCASYSPNYDPVVAKTGDGQCSSYDVQWCPWSNLPDDDFMIIDDRSYTIGQFVWTGFDYLGEPTPYDEYWPSRSSYFGICDLAGLPKDRYYLYRSQWNKQDHTLHILPHWTWQGREGQVTPVYVYTDYPEAELFINGKSQGRIKKNPDAHTLIAPLPTTKEQQATVNDGLLDRYRLRWNHVVYEPGEVKVIAYDAEGNAVMEKTIHTAGKAKALQLDADRTTLKANSQDLAFVTVSLTDGTTLVPDADDDLTFEVIGAGSFKAVCNGDATSLEPFTHPQMKLFHGQLVAVVQAGNNAGTLTLRVKDKARGLKSDILITVE